MPTLATAGHVDHGKSTLVLALTGQDPDRLVDEKARGLTIDLGFAWMEMELEAGNVLELAFVDVPGHEKYMDNMLAGAAQIDGCLFVVSAKEKMKPQSWEHLHILDNFSINGGVVALTNVSGMESNQLSQIQAEIKTNLAGTFLEDAEIIKTDAPSNTGIAELKSALQCLLKKIPPSLNLDNPRLWIDRSFVIDGSGTVVTATLNLGSVEVGDELVLLPANKPVKVRAIESLGKQRQQVEPGTRTALNLSGISKADAKRGDVLVKSSSWWQTKVFDASLNLLKATDVVGVETLKEKGAFMVYLGTGNFPARLKILDPTPIVRIFLSQELPLKLGDRFILKDVGRGKLVGGGEILDLDPIQKSSANPVFPPSIEKILEQRGGWLETKELKLLAYPLELNENENYIMLGNWTILNSVLTDIKGELSTKLEAGSLTTLQLSDLEQQILEGLEGVEIKRGKASFKNQAKNDSHPFLDLLDENPFAPPAPDDHIDKGQLRDLIQQNLVVESKGIYFSKRSVAEAQKLLAQLLGEKPEGITVSDFRQALSTTRKYTLSLFGYFDATGITRRRGDNRIAGARLSI